MRLVQLVLAALSILLAIGRVDADDIASVAATANGEKMRELLSFSDFDPSKRESTDQEERGATGAAAGAGAVAGVSTPLRTGDSEGERITVTTYDGNGLVQRFTKWWNRHFGSDEKTPRSTRRLRQTTSNEAN